MAAANMESVLAAQAALKTSLGLQPVKLVRNANYKRNGTKSYVSALARYGFNPTKQGPYFHKSVKQHGLAGIKKVIGGHTRQERTLVKKDTSSSSSQEGEVTADDTQNDSEYLCEVSIGTPAQKFNLDFDTGSADLWVFSTELSKSTSTTGHNVYDPSKSTTYKKYTGATWEISYGDGSSASGNCGKDTVTIGGLSIKNQVIELAEKLSSEFASGSGDGLLGLAFSTINTVSVNNESDPAATPVQNMITQDDIPKTSELFTANFYSEASKKDSFYTFGYIDETLVGSQDVNWATVDNSQGFWMFESTSYSVNGTSTKQSGNLAIADTGTTLCLISDAAVEAFYKAIPGAKYNEQQQGYVFPADTKEADLPEFKVAVGDSLIALDKSVYAFEALNDGSGTVYGGIQSRGDNTFDILGDVFLRSVYAIFDVGNTRFGVVTK